MGLEQSKISPFFQDAINGARFCILHTPPEGVPLRDALVFVPPFAEEMNKVRRVAALQARAFALRGVAVLQVDLFGTGDSSGDFSDATWEIWREDVRSARVWIKEKLGVRCGLWGVRLGAMLATEIASMESDVSSLVLWQPVVSGEAYIAQFLRLKTVGAMFKGVGHEKEATDPRRQLATEGMTEVAGYGLHATLVREISEHRLESFIPKSERVLWFEISTNPNQELSPVTRRISEKWRVERVQVDTRMVTTEPFWSTVETAQCPELIQATLSAAYP